MCLQRCPNISSAIGINHNFKSVFAGIACAGQECFMPEHLAIGVVIAANSAEIDIFCN